MVLRYRLGINGFNFLSFFRKDCVEAYPINPGIDFGVSFEVFDGPPKLKHNVLKSIFLVFQITIIYLTEAPDGASVSVDDMNELMLFQPFETTTLID